MIKALIFDFDGVIVDSDTFHYNSWKHILKEYFKVNFLFSDYLQIKGVSRQMALNKLLQLYSINIPNNELKNEILFKKNEIFLKLINDITKDSLIPGVEQFILKYKPFYKIGLASASKNARLIINKLEINGLFDVIIDANETKNKKPDPEVFFSCLTKLNINPKNCIVFEDSINGVKASKNGGFLTCGVGNIEIIDYVDYYITNFLDFNLNDINS